jgi:hypothetical protein
MIKTLRITSVVAAILAGVLVKFFVLPMLSNVSGDPSVARVLDSPGVIERFKEKGAHANTTKPDTPLLVQQAIAYARILDPEPKVNPIRKGGHTPGIKTTLPPTTPKFQVFATTYFEGNPELSQALIDEPGKGRYWVRQSSMVGHLLIEQVKDGVVIVSNSEESFELEVEKISKTSLPKGKPTTSKGATTLSSYRRTSPTLNRASAISAKTPSVGTASKTPQPRAGTIPSEKADELINRLRDLQRSSRSDKTNSALNGAERAARIEELIRKFKSPAASTGGAGKPAASGEKAKGAGEDPNRISAEPDDGKIQPDSAE